MKVYLCKNVEKIGMEGEIVKVSDGFGANFLIPKKLAIRITDANESFYKSKQKNVEHRKEVIASQTSMLAEKIKQTKLTLKRKIHDGEKLYGSVSPQEVVDLLIQKGIKASKSQVVFEKSIKTKGTHSVIIKLSSRLQPKLTLTVAEEHGH